jgi:copper chaperone CopZ
MKKMKKQCAIILLTAGLLAGCATPESGDSGLTGSESALTEYREVELTVYGLSCPLCSNNLDGQLRRIQGVDDAAIDLKTGAVAVRLAEGHSVTSGDLARAVKNAGFTLKRIEPKGARE